MAIRNKKMVQSTTTKKTNFILQVLLLAFLAVFLFFRTEQKPYLAPKTMAPGFLPSSALGIRLPVASQAVSPALASTAIAASPLRRFLVLHCHPSFTVGHAILFPRAAHHPQGWPRLLPSRPARREAEHVAKIWSVPLLPPKRWQKLVQPLLKGLKASVDNIYICR